MEIKNAIIESTMLGIEDHGIFTFWLYLKYDGSGQGAGGHALDDAIKNYEGKFLCRIGTAGGMSIIMEILKVVGVEKWEDLKGKIIRVKAESSKVHAIGNVIKENWLDFSQYFINVKEFTKLIKE
jgi:hypothetical protein